MQLGVHLLYNILPLLWLADQVTWLPNFIQLTASRRALWREKKDNSRKISIFYLQKLMAMSSYMVNSKYVEPKFPPCEEYSQNSYIPDQGTGYYNPAQDTDFQHPGIYSRSNYSEQAFSCNTVQGSTVQPRGHVQEQASLPSPFTAQTEQCPSVQMSGPRTCGQQQNTKNQNGIQAKQPAIVYPWMKKVHVTTGKIDSLPSLSISFCASCVPVLFPPYESFCEIFMGSFEGAANYTSHKFLLLRK